MAQTSVLVLGDGEELVAARFSIMTAFRQASALDPAAARGPIPIPVMGIEALTKTAAGEYRLRFESLGGELPPIQVDILEHGSARGEIVRREHELAEVLKSGQGQAGQG